MATDEETLLLPTASEPHTAVSSWTPSRRRLATIAVVSAVGAAGAVAFVKSDTGAAALAKFKYKFYLPAPAHVLTGHRMSQHHLLLHRR